MRKKQHGDPDFGGHRGVLPNKGLYPRALLRPQGVGALPRVEAMSWLNKLVGVMDEDETGAVPLFPPLAAAIHAAQCLLFKPSQVHAFARYACALVECLCSSDALALSNLALPGGVLVSATETLRTAVNRIEVRPWLAQLGSAPGEFQGGDYSVASLPLLFARLFEGRGIGAQ